MGIESLVQGICESIVNPKCDECGTSLSTPKNEDIGLPRLCSLCEYNSRVMYKKQLDDYISQERPDRSVHIVKMPKGGLK